MLKENACNYSPLMNFKYALDYYKQEQMCVRVLCTCTGCVHVHTHICKRHALMVY